MTRKQLLLAGGDLRQYAAAAKLAEQHTVYLTGFDRLGAAPPGVTEVSPAALHSLKPDVLILPMPVTADGVFVQAPLSRETFRLSALLPLLPKGAAVFGGRIADAALAEISKAGLVPTDYAKNTAFAVRNAVPTAEGAIKIALEELPVTLHGLPVLILGAGRIAQALQTRLRALGAAVTVAARRCSDRARSKGGKKKPAGSVCAAGLFRIKNILQQMSHTSAKAAA